MLRKSWKPTPHKPPHPVYEKGTTILGKTKYGIEVRQEQFADNDFLWNGLDAEDIVGGAWWKVVWRDYNEQMQELHIYNALKPETPLAEDNVAQLRQWRVAHGYSPDRIAQLRWNERTYVKSPEKRSPEPKSIESKHTNKSIRDLIHFFDSKSAVQCQVPNKQIQKTILKTIGAGQTVSQTLAPLSRKTYCPSRPIPTIPDIGGTIKSRSIPKPGKPSTLADITKYKDNS
jgi:hypothetical protein